ncbi:MAG: ribosome biogenesis protein Nop16 [Piptocephalis tieghemiana]|nr:MAG: ribosome biogenesis protein Nop16 [Piptocephalis tieghemiana]
MTRVSTRKRNRTPYKKVTRRTANKHFKKQPLAFDTTVAKYWDKTKTLSQNYARLGLSSRLNGLHGGSEKDIIVGGEEEEEEETVDLDAMEEAEIKKVLGAGQALVERDDAGNIVKVIMGEGEEEQEGEEVQYPKVPAKTDTIREMEARAANGCRDERKQSDGEKEWIAKLIAKHGDDYERMFRDRKLNIYQQTVGQLRKRCKTYLESQGK